MENDKSMIGQASKALAAGQEVKAASDPKRPSRGVKKIDKSMIKWQVPYQRQWIV